MGYAAHRFPPASKSETGETPPFDGRSKALAKRTFLRTVLNFSEILDALVYANSSGRHFPDRANFSRPDRNAAAAPRPLKRTFQNEGLLGANSKTTNT